MIIAASNGQYSVTTGQSHMNLVGGVVPQQQVRANCMSHSNSSSSSLSPMRPSSSCSPTTSNNSSSDASPKTTVIYGYPASANSAPRSSRKSPNQHRYHPYAPAAHIDANAYTGSNGQFYSTSSATASPSVYYDQYSQASQHQQFYPSQSALTDYTSAVAAAANGMQYNATSLYADQSYYYAAQNAAASFLMQQTQHPFDSSVICTPNMHNFVAESQSWVLYTFLVLIL